MIQLTAQSIELVQQMEKHGSASVALEQCGMTYADYRGALEEARREFERLRDRAVNREERKICERGIRNCDIAIAMSRDEFEAAAEKSRRKRTKLEQGN